jgi:ketosteroid isomerase-like protein
MKSTIALLLLALAPASLTNAQAAKSHPTQGTDDAMTQSKALFALENKWVDALVKSDIATLDSIFAESYVDTDEHGRRSDKQAVFSVLKSGDLHITSIKLSDMLVQLYGDAAIVIGTAAQVGNFKGQPLTPTIVFTDTFIKRNGKWRAVASHRSVVL